MFELKKEKKKKKKKKLWMEAGVGGQKGGEIFINLLNTFHVQILWVNFKDHA